MIVESWAIDLGKLLDEQTPERSKAGVVEECLRLDVAELRRADAFRSGDVIGEMVWSDRGVTVAMLQYRLRRVSADSAGMFCILTKSEQVSEMGIALTVTHPHFGGRRWWLHCPCDRCGRRVRVLYSTEDEIGWACRQCHGLQYRSAQHRDSRVDRLRKDFDLLAATVNDQSGTLFANMRRQKLATKALQRGYCRSKLSRG